jgi:hypothetical protein
VGETLKTGEIMSEGEKCGKCGEKNNILIKNMVIASKDGFGPERIRSILNQKKIQGRILL